MSYVPNTPGSIPNLVDVAKRLDPDGKVAKIAEVLEQFNPILEDVPLVQGNLPTGHRTTVRSDLPTPTWRKLNYGVKTSKSSTEQVDETIGMLEDYSEVDKDLAMLNGNTAEFRMSEDTPHLESMSNNMANTIFYGDTSQNPERFLGLAPRYDVLGNPADKPDAIVNSEYLKHIIDAGGTNSGDLTSIWYVVWGENTVHGIYPKGSKAGLQARDLGEVTLFDNEGGRYQGYRTHYQWKMGLCVRDWRYIVRIANVDLAQMDDTNAQKRLYQAMIKARYAVPVNNIGRGVFYSSAGVQAMLDISATEKANAALGYTKVFGKDVLSFRSTPIRACNAISEHEVKLA